MNVLVASRSSTAETMPTKLRKDDPCIPYVLSGNATRKAFFSASEGYAWGFDGDRRS